MSQVDVAKVVVHVGFGADIYTGSGIQATKVVVHLAYGPGDEPPPTPSEQPRFYAQIIG